MTKPRKSPAQKLAERWGLDFWINSNEKIAWAWDSILRLNSRLPTSCELSVWLALVKADRELAKRVKLPQCNHPESAVQTIANKEYPGGSVDWCSQCGAWRDDDSPSEWTKSGNKR